jgi:hypothetical protein
MQDKTTISGTGIRCNPSEELPYRIELWLADSTESVERVLARALDVQLARAIFKAAQAEHPERRVTLRKGSRIIADSSS